jgi:hypothetical protein
VGGGGSGASATAQAASGTGLLASSKGNSAPFSANAARTASTAGGGQRSLAIRRSGGLAGKQLFAVSKDMKSNRGSSQAYGTTYDGSAGPSGSGIGGDNNIAAGGTGQGAGVSDSPESAYGRGPDDKLPDAPPNIDGENATPWQDALNKSLMYIAGAMLLCFLAGKLADNQTYGKIAAAVLGAIAAGLAIKAMSLGMEIGGGKYAQSLQGGLITVAATFALLQAGLCVAGSNEKVAAAMGDVSMLMKYAGAGAMVAMAVAYMKPLKSYPASEFENGKPPDARGSIIRPADIGTEEPAQRYLALAHRSGRAEA